MQVGQERSEATLAVKNAKTDFEFRKANILLDSANQELVRLDQTRIRLIDDLKGLPVPGRGDSTLHRKIDELAIKQEKHIEISN